MTDTTAADQAAPATDFPLDWSDPSDADLTWRHDDMHTPFCMAPLSWDYAQLIAGGFEYRYERLELPIEMRAQVFNGFLYFSWKPLVPEAEEEALDEQYVQTQRRHTPFAKAYWERAVPELRELYAGIADCRGRRASGRPAGRRMGGRLAASPARLVHPFLRDHRAVPGHGRPGRPLRIGRRERPARRGDAADPGDDRRAGRGRLWTGPADRAGSGFARAGRGNRGGARRRRSRTWRPCPADRSSSRNCAHSSRSTATSARASTTLASRHGPSIPQCSSPRSRNGSNTRSNRQPTGRRGSPARPTSWPMPFGPGWRISPRSSRSSNGCSGWLVRSVASPRPTTTGSTEWPRRACARSPCGSGRGSRAKA